MLRLYIKCVLFGALAVLVTSEDTCPAVKHDCTCEFDASAEDGGEPVVAETASKTEILAAAAGAMTPLLLGGAGLGIYKLIKSKGNDSMDMDRSGSRMSEDMDDPTPRKRKPPPYDGRRGSQGVSLTDVENTRWQGRNNNAAF